MSTRDRPPDDREPPGNASHDTTMQGDPWLIVGPRGRGGVPGKGNAVAKRYRGVTPKERTEDAPAEHTPVPADPQRLARIEADMALAMGFLPAPGQAQSAPAQPVQAKNRVASQAAAP